MEALSLEDPAMIIEEQRGVDERAMLETFENDVNGAPWMVVTDAHAHVVTAILEAIRYYKHREGLSWHISSELAVIYRRPSGRRLTLSPDGGLLRLHDPAGALLPTGDEIASALAAAQARAEAAEAEVARLRARSINGRAAMEG